MKRRQFISAVPLVGLVPYVTGIDVTAASAAPAGKGEATGAASRTEGPIVESLTDRWGVVPAVTKPPVLDGKLGDPAWKRARPLGGFLTPYALTPADGRHEIRVLYDAKNLYVGVRYEDSDAGATVANVEVLLGVGTERFEVSVPVKEVRPPYSNSWGPATPVEGARMKTGSDAKGVTVELAIPLAKLGVEDVAEGSEWRINVLAQHEMGTKPLASWMPIRRVMNSYSGGGSASVQGEVTDEGRLGAIFLGRPPALPDRPEASSPWTPDGVRLDYTGFTRKKLSFARRGLGGDPAVGLAWRTPDGVWHPLDEVETAAEGDRLIVTFTHPGPLTDGQYDLRIGVEGAGASEDRLAVLTFDRHALIRAGDAAWKAEMNR
ncbi:MAG TPA: hypothetical protein VI076_17110 [Actinopolymorphaceae bacterium]